MFQLLQRNMDALPSVTVYAVCVCVYIYIYIYIYIYFFFFLAFFYQNFTGSDPILLTSIHDFFRKLDFRQL